jgi:hypothetical protein
MIETKFELKTFALIPYQIITYPKNKLIKNSDEFNNLIYI